MAFIFYVSNLHSIVPCIGTNGRRNRGALLFATRKKQADASLTDSSCNDGYRANSNEKMKSMVGGRQ
jgi:hypothetical protein